MLLGLCFFGLSSIALFTKTSKAYYAVDINKYYALEKMGPMQYVVRQAQDERKKSILLTWASMAETYEQPWRKSMVPRAGLEPARTNVRRILSPLRLPIPPPRHTIFLEAAPGFEPGIRVLQTHALPLGYAARQSFNLFNNKTS